jgi:hypothetical protein
MVATTYLWDPIELNVIQATSSESTTTNYNTEPRRGAVISVDTGGDIKFLHSDACGSVAAATTLDQSIVGNWSYSAFGTMTDNSGSLVASLGFRGRFGETTSSDGNRIEGKRRVYSTSTFRWLSRNALLHGGQTRNPFALTANNPLRTNQRRGTASTQAGQQDPPQTEQDPPLIIGIIVPREPPINKGPIVTIVPWDEPKLQFFEEMLVPDPVIPEPPLWQEPDPLLFEPGKILTAPCRDPVIDEGVYRPWHLPKEKYPRTGNLMTCQQFLDWLTQDGANNPREEFKSSSARKCGVDLFCGPCRDGVPLLSIAYWYTVTPPPPAPVAGGRIPGGNANPPRPFRRGAICLPSRAPASELRSWYALFVHEDTHIGQFVRDPGIRCSQDMQLAQGGPVPPNIGGGDCRTCIDMEREAYTRQAEILYPLSTYSFVWQEEFIEAGICISCAATCRASMLEQWTRLRCARFGGVMPVEPPFEF